MDDTARKIHLEKLEQAYIVPDKYVLIRFYTTMGIYKTLLAGESIAANELKDAEIRVLAPGEGLSFDNKKKWVNKDGSIEETLE